MKALSWILVVSISAVAGALASSARQGLQPNNDIGTSPTPLDTVVGYTIHDAQVSIAGNETRLHAIAATNPYTAFLFFNSACSGSSAEAAIWQEIHNVHGETIALLPVLFGDDTVIPQQYYDRKILTDLLVAQIGSEEVMAVGVGGFPQAFVVDRRGTVVYKTRGVYATDDLRDWIHEHYSLGRGDKDSG